MLWSTAGYTGSNDFGLEVGLGIIFILWLRVMLSWSESDMGDEGGEMMMGESEIWIILAELRSEGLPEASDLSASETDSGAADSGIASEAPASDVACNAPIYYLIIFGWV